MTTILLFEFTTLALGVALFIWLFVKGDFFEAMVLGMAVLLGMFMEWTGVTRFHLHYYSADFLFTIGRDPASIPLVIGVGWALVFFTTRRLADRLVTPWYLMPSVAGLLALTLDFYLDPMMARSLVPPVGFTDLQQCVTSLVPGEGFGVGAWTWCLPELFNDEPIEQYMGVPLANYLGWFIIVAAYEFVLETAVRWYNVQAMSRIRQVLLLFIVVVIAGALIFGALWFFQFLLNMGVKNLWLLVIFAGLGILGLAISGLNRTSWGFDWKCIALIALDTIICWYGYFSGEFVAVPANDIVLRLALINGLAILLALWIMIPPFWQPVNNFVGPPVIIPSPYLTPDQIVSARAAADQSADEVMESMFQNGDIDEVNELLAELLHSHDQDIFNQLPIQLRSFFADHSLVDPSVDQDQVRRGQELFLRYSGLCVTALNLASLAESYAMEGSGRVLGRTGRLVRPRALKRIAETAQLVMYVIWRDGLMTPDNANFEVGRGIRAALRVRLMHAAIRWLINQGNQPDIQSDQTDYDRLPWNVAEDGEPINQMEMVFTLLCFCWVPIRAMRDVGLAFTIQEANDYVYMWKVVGKHMGIQEDLLPGNVHQAAWLMEYLKEHYAEESDSAEELNDSALWVMEQMLERKANLGGIVNRSIPRVLQVELVDAATRQNLRAEQLTLLEELVLQPLVKLAFGVLGWLDIMSPHGWAKAFKIRIGELMLSYYVDHPDLVGTDLFELPVELQN